MSTIDSPRCKKDVDNMIDYRRSQRPHDESPIRINCGNIIMHKALNPQVPLDRHIQNEDLPFKLLYRGLYVVSIPGEKADQKKKLAERDRVPPRHSTPR